MSWYNFSLKIKNKNMKNTKQDLPKGTVVPNHVALVMDGNRRWARAKGFSPTKGHEASAKSLKETIRASREFGIHTLTLWGFSTENWDRSPREVSKILSIGKKSIQESRKEAKEYGIRFIHLGRKDRLPKSLMDLIKKTEEETKNYKNHILNMALDYGGRDEIIRATKKIVKDKIPARKINEKLISSYLDTADQPYPNPDLFIRTSGEQRTSGFLPWQSVYSEFYWERDHLPDFTVEKLKNAVLDYSRRRKRFGGDDKENHFTFKPEMAAKLELAWWRLRNIPEGTRFRDYAIEHIKEQYGMSKKLTKEAAILMTEAMKERNKKKWSKAKKPLKEFYTLIKDEMKLAFEPSIVASMEVKLWKDIDGAENIQGAGDVENTAKELYAEVYRISIFQATKLAHLRVLAGIERNLAEKGMGDHHWEKAEDYLEKYYYALKERVA